jgi:epoxyqueuosine reductase
MSSAAEFLRKTAREMGFPQVRFARLKNRGPRAQAYEDWVAAGRHGGLEYLQRHAPLKTDPRKLLPSAKSAVVLGMPYAFPLPPDPGGLTGRVSCYAWGRDYHNLIGKRLRRLEKTVRQTFPGTETYAGVDARPLLERGWAEWAGLGAPGKNCMTLLPGQTSFLFLAVMLTNLELPPDPPATDHCGTCVKCLDACPTGALLGAGELDSRLCISFHTIENRGDIPVALRAKTGRWLFGCDDCQTVCPHIAEGDRSAEPDFSPRPGQAWMDLPAVLALDEQTFATRFQGSAIRRARLVGLQRNALVVLGNIGDPAGLQAARKALKSPNALLRRHAAWAVWALGDREGLAQAWSRETDSPTRTAISQLLEGTAGDAEGSV